MSESADEQQDREVAGEQEEGEELTGAAPFLAVPAANSAERQQARWQDGATLEQIYAMEGIAGERIG